MTITFKKRSGRKHVVSYTNHKGEEQWFEADDFLILHDLSHFAIESTLNFRTAFWGLMEQGVPQEIFENKEARNALLLSHEAWYAEQLANLFLIELSQGMWDDINETLASSLRQSQPEIPLFNLDKIAVDDIRALLHRLVTDWKSLSAGEMMVLNFLGT